jgi:electron transfer flavoprotein beta subunit
MKIVVCVKQVPDTTEVEIDEKTGTIIREGVPSMLNPFDEFALNEAVRLVREAEGESEIVVLSMGPPQAEEALKKCLAIGADRAVLLSDRIFAGADTWATSLALTRGIEKIGDFNAIFCGHQATDGDTAQVGPEIARQLGIPQVTYVEKVESIEGKNLICLKETDEGYVRLRCRLPALLACISPSDFEPIIPKMGQILKARKKPLETWNAADVAREGDCFGLEGSPTQVIRTYPPPKSKGGGVKIEEAPEEAVRQLVAYMEKEGLLP